MSNINDYKFGAVVVNKTRSYGGDVAYVLQVRNPKHNIFSSRYTSEWINASIDDVLKYKVLTIKLALNSK